jgi:Integral membrane protein TerC family
MAHGDDRPDSRASLPISTRRAPWLSVAWLLVGLAVGAPLLWLFGTERAVSYWAVYVVERSLSLDNVFIFLLILDYFAVLRHYRRRVVWWAIALALVLRAAAIAVGAELITRFAVVTYLLGAALVVFAPANAPQPQRARQPRDRTARALSAPGASAHPRHRGGPVRRQAGRRPGRDFDRSRLAGARRGRHHVRRRLDPGRLRDHHRRARDLAGERAGAGRPSSAARPGAGPRRALPLHAPDALRGSGLHRGFGCSPSTSSRSGRLGASRRSRRSSGSACCSRSSRTGGRPPTESRSSSVDRRAARQTTWVQAPLRARAPERARRQARHGRS